MLVNDETAILVRRDDQHREALMQQDAKIDALETQVSALQRTSDGLQRQLDASTRETHSLQQQLRDREREVQRLRAEPALQGVAASVDSSEAVEEMERQLSALRAEMDQRLQEEAEARETVEAARSRAEEAAQQQAREVKTLQQRVATLEAEATQAARMAEVKETSLAAARAEAEAATARYRKLQEQKSQEVSSSTLAVTELKQQLAEKEHALQEKQDALDDAGISELRPWSVLRLDCPYALFERVKLEADKRGGLVRDADYGAQIALTILLPQPEEAEFRKALQELSAGSLAPETTGTELRGVRIR